MSNDSSHWLLFEDAQDYQTLREVLLRADYTVPGVLNVMGTPGGSVSTTDAPLVLERTQQGRPLDTFMRLFLTRTSVSIESMRSAIAPMSPEKWERIGLIGIQDGSAFARLKVLPFDRLFVAQEFYTPGVKQPPDFVVGIGAATLTMANFMIRRRTRLSLDLGTGCGLLALLKSGESDEVIAVDRNPRAVRMTSFNARLNDLRNIDCREGDLFEPVEGLKFDLILSNAPFVISPSSGYLYLDGGMKGDQFCQRLVHGAAEVLNEKGYCQFLCNWAHLKDQDWEQRLAGWFKGTGCNVWVLRGPTDEPSVYARKWIQHVEVPDSSQFLRMYEEWMNYYAQEHIEAMSMGLITMQRAANSPNWFRIDSQPEAKNRDLGEDILRIFELQNFLERMPTDELLAQCVLLPAPELRLEVRYEPSSEGWRALSHHLRVERAFEAFAKTDELAANFIVRCDGKRTVDAILSEIASNSGVDPRHIMSAALHVIRHLVQRGFLLPWDLPAHGGIGQSVCA